MAKRDWVYSGLFMMTAWVWLACASVPVAHVPYQPKPHFSGQVELVRNPTAALEQALSSSVYEYTVHGEAIAMSELSLEAGGERQVRIMREAASRVEHEPGRTRLTYTSAEISLTYGFIATFEIRRGIQDNTFEVELRSKDDARIAMLTFVGLESVQLLIDALAVLNPSFVQHPKVSKSN